MSKTEIATRLFRKAHKDASSGLRPRMTYRDRFKSALRRAWRDELFRIATEGLTA